MFKLAIFEDNYGKRHEYYKAVEEGDDRKSYVNIIAGTHCTPELFAGIVVEDKMLFVSIYYIGK